MHESTRTQIAAHNTMQCSAELISPSSSKYYCSQCLLNSRTKEPPLEFHHNLWPQKNYCYSIMHIDVGTEATASVNCEVNAFLSTKVFTA